MRAAESETNEAKRLLRISGNVAKCWRWLHRSSYDKKTIAGSQLGYLSEISIAIYSRKNWLSGNRFSKTAPFKGSRTHGLFLGRTPGRTKTKSGQIIRKNENKIKTSFFFEYHSKTVSNGPVTGNLLNSVVRRQKFIQQCQQTFSVFRQRRKKASLFESFKSTYRFKINQCQKRNESCWKWNLSLIHIWRCRRRLRCRSRWSPYH